MHNIVDDRWARYESKMRKKKNNKMKMIAARGGCRHCNPKTSSLSFKINCYRSTKTMLSANIQIL